MIVYGIDPGTEQSALVEYDSTQRAVRNSFTDTNESIMAFLYTESRHTHKPDSLVIEKFEAMGMRVGQTVFDTVWWSGRMYEIWIGQKHMLSRHAVKLHICHSRKANDADIRQALYDRFGGDRTRAKGTKLNPGPLYSVGAHEMAALALAITFTESA